MIDVENLNSVDIEKKKAILINVISQCMVANSMTLEVLDDAYGELQEWYRKNALIQQCRKADSEPAAY